MCPQLILLHLQASTAHRWLFLHQNVIDDHEIELPQGAANMDQCRALQKSPAAHSFQNERPGVAD